MDACIKQLGEATPHSISDVNSGSWEVEIAKGDKEEPAFSSNYGLLQFIGMLIGMPLN